MKKLIVGTLALVMLCGCGGSKKPTQTVCSGSLNGQNVDVTLKFDENEALTDLIMDMKVDAGSKEAAEIAKVALESQKETLLSGFGENVEADATFSVDGSSVVAKITVDITKSADFSGVDIDGTKADIIKAFENAGLTCK